MGSSPLLRFVVAFTVASAVVAPTRVASSMPLDASMRHTKLVRSVPAAGSSIATPPAAISLWFSKPVQARLTRVHLTSAGGAAVALDAPRTQDAGDTVIVAALKGGLAKGSYTVTWATTSRDSHVIKGSFSFSVAGTTAGDAGR